MPPVGQVPGAFLTTDEDGLPLRCQGAALVDAKHNGAALVFACCENLSTDARFLAYEGWCLWMPLCEAHTALFDADVASELEAA
jgi:hypothetical protein